MVYKNSFFMLLILLLIVNFDLIADQKVNFIKGGTLDTLKTLSAEHGKIIFVDCFTTWCAPCKLMDKNVFSLDSVGKFFNDNFINAKIDMDNDSSKSDFIKNYKVNAYPTLLFLNEDGVLLYEVKGAYPADRLIEIARFTIDSRYKVIEIIDRYNSGDRSEKFLLNYYALMAKRRDLNFEEYKSFMNKIDYQYLFGDEPLELILATLNWDKSHRFTVKDSLFNFLIREYETIRHYKNGAHLISRLLMIAFQDSELAINNRDEELFNTSIFLLDRFDDIGNIKYEKLGSNFEGYLNTNGLGLKQRIKFYDAIGDLVKLRLTEEQLIEKNKGNWEGLLDLAFGYLNEKDAEKLMKAEKFLKMSIEIESNWYNHFHLAKALLAMGRKKEAIEYAKKSVELANSMITDNLLKNKMLSASNEILDSLKIEK